jgi:hypothetical protein
MADRLQCGRGLGYTDVANLDETQNVIGRPLGRPFALGAVGIAARFEPREMITLAHALSPLSQLGDRRSLAARD